MLVNWFIVIPLIAVMAILMFAMVNVSKKR